MNSAESQTELSIQAIHERPPHSATPEDPGALFQDVYGSCGLQKRAGSDIKPDQQSADSGSMEPRPSGINVDFGWHPGNGLPEPSGINVDFGWHPGNGLPEPSGINVDFGRHSKGAGRIDDLPSATDSHWQGNCRADKPVEGEVVQKPNLASATDSIVAAPTYAEQKEAAACLVKSFSKLIPEADRNTMKSMIEAICNGDENAFGKILQEVSGDRGKLKNLIEETNKVMEDKGCSARLGLTSDGKVWLGPVCGSVATCFDPASGKAEVKLLETGDDGSVRVSPIEPFNSDVHANFMDLGAQLVRSTNLADRDFSRAPIKNPENSDSSKSLIVTPYMSPVPGFPLKIHW